jgi:hypothetical protein
MASRYADEARQRHLRQDQKAGHRAAQQVVGLSLVDRQHAGRFGRPCGHGVQRFTGRAAPRVLALAQAQGKPAQQQQGCRGQCQRGKRRRKFHGLGSASWRARAEDDL